MYGTFTILYTVKPVLSEHLRESLKVVALDRCLLNAGIFI